jgi:hypothetical protein
MKYKGIICFVYQKEKEEICKSINNDIHIIFSDDFNDSKKIKPEQHYIIVSLKMADNNPYKYKRMLLKFPNNDYPILHDNNGKFSNKVLEIHWETKIPYHNFTTISIIDKINNIINSTHLKEIGTLCKKEDGWEMIIEVHSDDNGILYDKNNPAYAHIKDINGKLLGKFAITKERPSSEEYIIDCDKNKIILPIFKKKIVDWASKHSPNYDEEDGLVKNWGAVKAEWRNLHQ